MTPPLAATAAFHAAFLLLVALVFPRPRVHVYSVLAVVLALGFWLKFVLLAALAHPLLEPVGAFSGSQEEWGRALAFATAGALGAAAVRAVHLVRARRAGPARPADARPDPPGWYRRRRVAAWAATGAAVLAAVAWNLRASVYQVGLEPRVVLPLHANAGIAWLLVLGFPLWIALLLDWERTRLDDRARALWVPLAEGFLASTSMLSRVALLLRLVPYGLASIEDGSLASRRGRRHAVVFAAAAAALLAASLTAVSWMRLRTYAPPLPPAAASAPAPPAPTAAPTPAGVRAPAVVAEERAAAARDEARRRAEARAREEARLEAEAVRRELAAQQRIAARRFMFRQVVGLATDRWIGLEGVLAVASSPERGAPLLVEALVEDPRRGARSLYQRLTGFTYAVSPGVTFLTLPGIVAVLAYSGSALFVFLGMAGVTALAFASEALALRLTGSAFVAAVAGTGLAYTLSQMNFPYLTAVFLVELGATLAVLGGLGGRRGGAR